MLTREGKFVGCCVGQHRLILGKRFAHAAGDGEVVGGDETGCGLVGNFACDWVM